MSESPAKVRLVRCPKCENLLPEVTDYAVYQCGGCGAVLRARNKHIGSGASSEKSGDESDAVSNKFSKESVNLDISKRSVRNMSVRSENGVKSNGSSGRRPERDDGNNTDFEDPKPSNKIGSRRSVRSSNWRRRETDLQEGSSSYNYPPRLEYAELVQNTNDLEVEDDRDELLRKLDELKDQIVRSRDKSKEKVQVFNDPYANMHHNNHSLLPSSNQVQVFNDPFRSQNHRIAPIMPYEQNPYHPYFSGQYVSGEMTDNRILHHPSCSCLLCYNKHQQAAPPPPPPLPPPVFQNDQILYHHDYNHRFSNLSLNSHSAGRSKSNDLRRHPRGILATGGRRCSPVAGGSPFVTCCKCFDVLQIPKTNTKKMRCAACSEVMVISVINKKLILSVFRVSEEAKDDLKIRGDGKWGSTAFSSEDFDNSGNYDFESMDKPPLVHPSFSSYKSAISYTSEDVQEVEKSVDLVIKDKNPSPPTSGSPLQDHFDYSTKYNRGGKGNISKRSDMEQAAMAADLISHGSSKKDGSDTDQAATAVDLASPGGSMKDMAVASEIEISPFEYSVNTGTSLESGDASRDMDQQRNRGSSESFFAGMIKRGFRDVSRSSQHSDQEKVNVMVNGHPIPDRLVKKAEKLAGPIQPGEYWYDSRAGFWGVIGGPCRGIIPPFIEEFNHPMPEKCADGDTTIFVNGRELHQKDLELLASRGLPTETDRSYVIEISGRVLNVDSGQELEGLGKLAPTVERKKHGFGMKPPRTVTMQ